MVVRQIINRAARSPGCRRPYTPSARLIEQLWGQRRSSNHAGDGHVHEGRWFPWRRAPGQVSHRRRAGRRHDVNIWVTMLLGTRDRRTSPIATGWYLGPASATESARYSSESAELAGVLQGLQPLRAKARRRGDDLMPTMMSRWLRPACSIFASSIKRGSARML